ncbi:MAG: electron transporter RnfE [Desulfobulbaceae bacterium]|nr:MAG: electron transporter RnfE [Desulfobulbaceae bacterium]
MHWSGNYGFGMGFGWFFMILFWAIFIFIVVALVKKIGSAGEQETAENILKKRYARGEISKDEFEQLKKDISE